MRAVAVGIMCVCSVAAADTKPAPVKPKVLVLPLAPTQIVDANAARAFDARLLVALDDTGRVQTITHDEEPECTTLPCLATLGTQTGAAYVLQLAAVPEGSTLTLFGTLVDVKTATAWRRIELPKLSSATLAKAPPELVPQVLGSPGPTALTFSRPTSAAGVTAITALADQVTALRAFKVLSPDTQDRSAPTHRADLVFTQLDIAEPRHGICKWYEGTLTGTFSVVDLSNGRVVWSKTITEEASRRVHFSSRSEIVDLLVSQAVTDWMTAFRAAGVLKSRTEGPRR